MRKRKKVSKKKRINIGYYLRIISAGLLIPTIGILTLALSFALMGVTIYRTILYAFLVPLVWGLWNLFYYTSLKGKKGMRTVDLFLIGTALGFIDATIQISIVDLPLMIGLTGYSKYLLLLILPLSYGLIWAFIMKKINSLIIE